MTARTVLCDIDDCPHLAFYHVPGYPDATDLCRNHVDLACDCDDPQCPVDWCRLHGKEGIFR